MSAKKKKQSNSPLRVIIILVLLGLLAYKHQLFDGKLLENIPTIESNEEKPEILTSPQHGGALEIPMIQSSTGGQILKRKGYTLSYNADYKTPQWVAWELTKKETKGKEGRTNKFLPDPDVRGAKAYTGDYTKSIYDTKRPTRIGNNKVAVPQAFYKVILINDKKNPQAIGFIFPNSAGHKPLKKYMVTVDSVEKRTDIDFFPALPDEIENRIEAELVQELP